ncbi:MAG: hypothetical protein AB1798_14740 [Spirochaetota bacterium]
MIHSALRLIEQALDEPMEWIISDQVYIEFYRLLRNPLVLKKPLDAPGAYERINFFRNQSGFLHCGYETGCFQEMIPFLENKKFPASKTFDLLLAVTLKKNGVRTFYTRNVKNFRIFPWFSLSDPISDI